MVLYSICVQTFHYLTVISIPDITFGADLRSSLHVDNNRKYILILGEGPT